MPELRIVPRADGTDFRSAGGEDQNLVGIAVNQQDAVVGRDRHAVRVGEDPLAPRRVKAAVRPENDDRRIGALVGIYPAPRIDRDTTDHAQRIRVRGLTPWPLDAIAPVAHDDDEVSVERHGVSHAGEKSGETNRRAPRSPSIDARSSSDSAKSKISKLARQCASLAALGIAATPS